MSEATEQSDNIVPPRRGYVLALTVDSTARAYDLTKLPLGAVFRPGAPDYVYLTLTAVTNDIYLYFDTQGVTVDLDNTAVNTAGSAFTATSMLSTMPQVLPAGTTQQFRINRRDDAWIHVKAASTSGTLRFNASSQRSNAA